VASVEIRLGIRDALQRKPQIPFGNDNKRAKTTEDAFADVYDN
jgi:hypothetical protein